MTGMNLVYRASTWGHWFLFVCLLVGWLVGCYCFLNPSSKPNELMNGFVVHVPDVIRLHYFWRLYKHDAQCFTALPRIWTAFAAIISSKFSWLHSREWYRWLQVKSINGQFEVPTSCLSWYRTSVSPHSYLSGLVFNQKLSFCCLPSFGLEFRV